MNGGGRAPALKHLPPKGKVSRVLTGCEGGRVSTSFAQGEGHVGHAQIFPSCTWHLLHMFRFGMAAHRHLGPFWFGLVLQFSHLAMFCLGSYKQAQLKNRALDMETVWGIYLGDIGSYSSGFRCGKSNSISVTHHAVWTWWVFQRRVLKQLSSALQRFCELPTPFNYPILLNLTGSVACHKELSTTHHLIQ